MGQRDEAMRQICLMIAFGMLLTAQQVISIDAGGPGDQGFSPADGGALCFTAAPGMTCSYTRAAMGPGSLSTLRYGWVVPFTYTISTISGTCDVKLTMVEPRYTSAGQRVFTVSINGAASPPIDLFALAGGQNLPYVYESKTVASSGTVTIAFAATVGNALVNQIDLVCTSPTSGTITDAQFNVLMQTWLATHQLPPAVWAASLITTTPTAINMAPGGVWTPSGNSIYSSNATISVNGGMDTGRFWLGYDPTGQRICQFSPGVGGINIANYTVNGFAGNTCSTPVQPGIYTAATVPITGGVFGPPNDFRTDAVAIQIP